MRSSAFQEKLEKTLLVCRNEWGSLIWLMLLNFILSAGLILAFSAVNAIFIWRLGFEKLPVCFIITGLLMLPYFTIYTQIETRFNRMWLLIISFIVYGALIAGSVFALMQQPKNPIIIITVYVISTCILLLVNTQFWSFANTVYHPRQGKRLFPLLGFGGTLGAIIMGFNLKYLVSMLGAVKLLFVWSGSFFLSALFVFLIFMFVRFPTQGRPSCALSLKDVVFGSFAAIRKIPIMSVISVIVLVMSFVSFILYFQFNRAVGETIVGELQAQIQTQPSLFENRFVGYVGAFHAVLYLAIILVYQIFFTSRIVSGMGIVNSLFLQPALLAIPVIFSLVKPGFEKMLQVGYFINVLCLATFFRTASESIFGSVPEQQREEAMCFIKIIITPLSIGMSGLLLVWMIRLFPDSDKQMLALNIIIPVALIIWIFAISKLKKLFIETLFNNFATGGKSQDLSSYLNFSKMKSTASLEILRRVMAKGSKRMKIFALELAGEMKLSILRDDILEILDTEDREIRSAAFNALGKIGGKKLYSTLMKIYKKQDNELKLVLLKNLFLIDLDSFIINAPFLLAEEEDGDIAGYLIGKIWKKKPLNVEQETVLLKLLDSEEEKSVTAAIKCLSFDKEGKFRKKLLSFLDNPSPLLRREALKSVASMKLKEAIPLLIKLLDSPVEDVAKEAANALSQIGQEAAVAAWESINDGDSWVLNRRKLEVLASTGVKENMMLIINNHLRFLPETLLPPMEIIARNLSAYTKFDKEEKQAVENMIESMEKEIKDNYRAVFSMMKEKKGKLDGILSIIIKERNDILKRIILLCLHLLNPDRRILTIVDNIFSGNVRKKNIALEALDNIFPEYRTRFIPLFEKETLEEEIKYISDLFSLAEKSPEMVLKIINRKPNDLMRAWVLYAAGEMKLASWKEEMEREVESKNSVISEYARMGLSIMNG